jgi:YesN/AraC family two-component response regulator
MAQTRILFVDDEPSIRLTLPAILEMHGFVVRTASDVPEALALIQKEEFDVLLSDLNIGQPGDGFTIVSAMRRTQPNAVTVIITGYPAFETALEAIRKQVDDYVVKPTDVDQLIEIIERKLHQRQPHMPLSFRRVGVILSENIGLIVDEWLQQMKRHPGLKNLKLTDGERINNLPLALREVLRNLENDDPVTEVARKAAEEHGWTRAKQGYSIELLLEEIRILRKVMLQHIQANLLGVNISFMVPDIIRLEDRISQKGIIAVRAYLEMSAGKSARDI